MKYLKTMVSLLTAVVTCGAFSGSAYAEASSGQIDAVSKLSDRLLEEYGVTRESMQTSKGRRNAVASSPEKIPVLVWCTEDIDHAAAEKQAIPILTSDLEHESERASFTTIKESSLNAILDSNVEPSAEVIQEFIEAERAAAREMYAELNGNFVKK